MKSVFSMVFAYGALLLASVAANATEDHLTMGRVMMHANLTRQPDAATYAFVSGTVKPIRSHIVLEVAASAKDEQADSADVETMLA